jgi:hypothetical protein
MISAHFGIDKVRSAVSLATVSRPATEGPHGMGGAGNGPPGIVASRTEFAIRSSKLVTSISTEVHGIFRNQRGRAERQCPGRADAAWRTCRVTRECSPSMTSRFHPLRCSGLAAQDLVAEDVEAERSNLAVSPACADPSTSRGSRLHAISAARNAPGHSEARVPDRGLG